MDVPRSQQQTAGILDAIDKALEDGKNVYVHCWGGIGRDGTVVGCWLVRHVMTGRSTVEYLVSNGRLEQVAAEGASDAADGVLDRAQRRLTTASAGLGGGDVEGAFVAAYDAYRMAAESLLVRPGPSRHRGSGIARDGRGCGLSPVCERSQSVREADVRALPPDAPQRPILRPGRSRDHP